MEMARESVTIIEGNNRTIVWPLYRNVLIYCIHMCCPCFFCAVSTACCTQCISHPKSARSEYLKGPCTKPLLPGRMALARAFNTIQWVLSPRPGTCMGQQHMPSNSGWSHIHVRLKSLLISDMLLNYNHSRICWKHENLSFIPYTSKHKNTLKMC